jgi:phosphoribosyl 1,2-cyclic phosphodiesterase
MKFSVLASGSKGNVSYIETENTRFLIDAGLSCRQIEKRLLQLGLKASDLDAIFITHEHADHIKGAGPLSRRYSLPIYLNEKTYKHGEKSLGNIPKTVIVQTGKKIHMKDVCIETFTKCHDAADPLGLTVSCNGIRVGIATDLGKSTKLVEDRLKGCDALIIEFNHDLKMLNEGPYPLHLKKRINGRDGHLSNKQAVDLLRVVLNDKTRFVVLAHLSEINNDPNIAHFEAVEVLNEKGLTNLDIFIGFQDLPGPLLEIH